MWNVHSKLFWENTTKYFKTKKTTDILKLYFHFIRKHTFHNNTINFHIKQTQLWYKILLVLKNVSHRSFIFIFIHPKRMLEYLTKPMGNERAYALISDSRHNFFFWFFFRTPWFNVLFIVGDVDIRYLASNVKIKVESHKHSNAGNYI